MYLKVYYLRHKDAQVAEVKAALPPALAHLEVNDNLGYPIVVFPDDAPYAQLERVREVLQAAGFETE